MTPNGFTLTDQQPNYDQFGLRENPFPYSPVPDDDPEIYCGQDPVSDAISETVSTVLTTGKSKHLVITGKYGNGKSHTLKYTQGLINDREDAVVGYVAQPGEDFLDIYREFMSDLGFASVQQTAYEYLADIASDETDYNPIGATAMEPLLNDGDVLLSELVPTAIKRLSELTQFADFARAIVHLVYEDTNLYAWQWLTGEGIRYEQRKELEIHSALDDDTKGVRAFTAMKNLLRELGYSAVFVFVDEFESVSRLSPKEEQRILNSIRHLMDQNSSGLCLLFGCAPEVWQDVMSEYHAFSERIGQAVALRPLKNEQLHQLIEAYLDTARIDGEPGIRPFTEESLESVLQRSQGNLRQALAICSRVLDAAAASNRDTIEAEFVQETI